VSTSVHLTLNDCQEDDNDKEEEGDVENDAVDLVLVSSGVLDLVADTPARAHAYVHVEHVALHRENTTHIYSLDHDSFLRYTLKPGLN